MADIIGIAAAGAGFLSLAGQVLDGIMKLRGFIATVDSAPREIHDLCHELEIFRGLLGEAGRRVQENAPVGINGIHLKDAFAHCERMRGHAESVLKRLEVNINKSKSISALKYTFKRKEIEAMLLGIERGKTSLLLANQSFESNLAYRRHELLIDRQRKINEDIAQVVSITTAVADLQEERFGSITQHVAASTLQTQSLKDAYAQGCGEIRETLSDLQDQSKSVSCSVAGQAQQIQCIAASIINTENAITNVSARIESLDLQIASQIRTETTTRMLLSCRFNPLSITFEQTSSHSQPTLAQRKRATRVLTVRLSKWFLHQQYELQLRYTNSRLPFALHACSIVRLDSPFFNACRTGDIEAVKVLLSKQLASIFDRTPCGATSLEIAVSHGQLEVCKLLRHAGILARFDDSDHRECLRALGASLDDFTEHNLSLLRVTTPLGNPDRDWYKEYCHILIDDATIRVYADVQIFSLLDSLQKHTAMPNLAHLKEYFECRSSHSRYGHNSFMSYISRVLSHFSSVNEIMASRDKYAWIVYALASEIALAHFGNRRQLDKHEWPHSVRQALCAVVRSGLSPHQTSGKFESPWVSDDWYRDLTMTPLGILCIEAVRIRVKLGYGTQSEWNENLNSRLQIWLSGLDSAGIDLLQYAKSESACFGGASGSLAIPWKTDGTITIVTGSRPEDWHISLWNPCEFHARLFWCLAEGSPIVSGLTARITEAYASSTSQDPALYDLPGSWPSDAGCATDKLESWLLRRTDDVLTQIEEDLLLLSDSDFFTKWHRIGQMLRS